MKAIAIILILGLAAGSIEAGWFGRDVTEKQKQQCKNAAANRAKSDKGFDVLYERCIANKEKYNPASKQKKGKKS